MEDNGQNEDYPNQIGRAYEFPFLAIFRLLWAMLLYTAPSKGGRAVHVRELKIENKEKLFGAYKSLLKKSCAGKCRHVIEKLLKDV